MSVNAYGLALRLVAESLAYADETRPWWLDYGWHLFHFRPFDATAGTNPTTLRAGVAQNINVFSVANGTGFVDGEPIVVIPAAAPQDAETFIVDGVVGNSITVQPYVRRAAGFAASDQACHCWYNATHPTGAGGTGQMQKVMGYKLAYAQRERHTGGYNLLGSAGDMLTTYVDTNGKTVPVGWESILPLDASSATNYTSTDHYVYARQAHGVDLQVLAGSAGGGIRSTGAIPVRKGEVYVAQAHTGRYTGSAWDMQIVDADAPATVIAATTGIDRINLYGTSYSVCRPTVLRFQVPDGTTNLEVRFVAGNALAGQCNISDVRLVRAREDIADPAIDPVVPGGTGTATARYIIDRPDLRAVAILGNSWTTQGLAAYLSEGLAARCGRAVRVINAGVSGNTGQQMIDRFATDVLPHYPGWCVIEHGVNDLASGAGYTTAVCQARVDTLIDLCRSHGIVPIFLGFPPVYTLTTTRQRNDEARARVDRVLR